MENENKSGIYTIEEILEMFGDLPTSEGGDNYKVNENQIITVLYYIINGVRMAYVEGLFYTIKENTMYNVSGNIIMGCLEGGRVYLSSSAYLEKAKNRKTKETSKCSALKKLIENEFYRGKNKKEINDLLIQLEEKLDELSDYYYFFQNNVNDIRNAAELYIDINRKNDENVEKVQLSDDIEAYLDEFQISIEEEFDEIFGINTINELKSFYNNMKYLLDKFEILKTI